MMSSDADHRRRDPGAQTAGAARSRPSHEPRPSRRAAAERKRRILILGFYRVASSFLSELERRHAALLEQVFVVDFNPTVYHALQARGVKILYGDIATPTRWRMPASPMPRSSFPACRTSLLKGTNNEKLVRHVRMVNPSAKIIATVDVLAETRELYAAGADYVTMARLDQANELVEAVTAAEAGLLTTCGRGWRRNCATGRRSCPSRMPPLPSGRREFLLHREISDQTGRAKEPTATARTARRMGQAAKFRYEPLEEGSNEGCTCEDDCCQAAPGQAPVDVHSQHDVPRQQSAIVAIAGFR